MSKNINKTNTHLEEALSDFISKISDDSKHRWNADTKAWVAL